MTATSEYKRTVTCDDCGDSLQPETRLLRRVDKTKRETQLGHWCAVCAQYPGKKRAERKAAAEKAKAGAAAEKANADAAAEKANPPTVEAQTSAAVDDEPILSDAGDAVADEETAGDAA